MNNQLKAKTLIVDPPWTDHGAERHYKTLPVETIKEIAHAVQPFVADDAHLWLWVTNSTITEGMALLTEFGGFQYRSILTWTKPRIGLGRYLRNTTEHVLFATRGKNSPVLFRGQGTWMAAPVQDHSHKPEEFLAIARRVSPGPFLELFARRRPNSNEDYFVWGNEINSDVTVPGFPVPSDAPNSEASQ